MAGAGEMNRTLRCFARTASLHCTHTRTHTHMRQAYMLEMLVVASFWHVLLCHLSQAFAHLWAAHHT